MSETLLGLTNINLFGNVVKELELVDPDKPIQVRAATEVNTTLSGNIPIDDIQLSSGDRVLVWKQNDPRYNGVYRVTNNSWERMVNIDNALTIGSVIRVKEGTKYGKNLFQLVEKSIIFIPSSTSVTFSNLVGDSSVNSIKIAGEEIISIPLWQIAGDSLEKFSARVADSINKDILTDYTATSKPDGVTIRAPKKDGDIANGRVVELGTTNLTATVAGPMSGSAFFDRRTFSNLGPKRAGTRNRKGENKQLERQLSQEGARLARIYGFTYEGIFYDLPKSVLFLVHGEGEAANIEELSDVSGPTPSRAPRATALTGLAAADFDFADGLRVWSYDKADYTIRMDVETGMFEDVLLAAMLGGSGGFDTAGMNARGMNARGMNARGMNARGMNARGMNARGGGNSD